MAKKVKSQVSLKDLLEAGCHFGHQSRRWNPKMKPYLFDVREGVHIFDLVKTKQGLEAAMEYLYQAAVEGKRIVFLGTKRQARAIVTEAAKKAGIPYVSRRWIGGAITNWEQIYRNISKLQEMIEKRVAGEYKKYTKKEQLLLDRQIARLERFYGGLKDLDQPPEVLFVVDVKKEEVAVKEARKRQVPVVATVDSDSDPDWAQVIIPSNDDAVGAIRLLVNKAAEAVAAGKQVWQKKNEKK